MAHMTAKEVADLNEVMQLLEPQPLESTSATAVLGALHFDVVYCWHWPMPPLSLQNT